MTPPQPVAPQTYSPGAALPAIEPLFPLPLAADLQADRWCVDGNERILVRGDVLRLSDAARRHQRRHGDAAARASLDGAYFGLVAQAVLAAHHAMFAGQRRDGAVDPVGHLEYHLFSRANREQRAVLLAWFHRMLLDPVGARDELKSFTPQAYVRAMCTLFRVPHPFAHEFAAGAEQARLEGFLHDDD